MVKHMNGTALGNRVPITKTTGGGCLYLKKTPNGYLLTTGMVSKLCGVAARTVSKWADNGRIKHWRVPGSNDRRFFAQDLLQFMRDNSYPIPATLLALVEGKTHLVLIGCPPGVTVLAKSLLPSVPLEVCESTFDLGAITGDPDKVGVLVVGSGVPVKEAAHIAGKLYERWTCIHYYGADQTPADNFEQHFPEGDASPLIKTVEFYLTHPAE
jgi:excisionase family DNA binding protein